MNSFYSVLIFGLVLCVLSENLSHANKNIKLDPSYVDLVHPRPFNFKPRFFFASLDSEEVLPKAADPTALIDQLPPIRDQGDRATCSIFSGIGMLEVMLVLKKGFDPKTIDLSEEWLQYLTSTISTTGSSSSKKNFRLFATYGVPKEQDWAYDADIWDIYRDYPRGSDGLAHKRCGKLKRPYLDSCLLGHRDPRLLTSSDISLTTKESPRYDPEFYQIRASAAQFRDKFLSGMEDYKSGDLSNTSNYLVSTVEDAKRLLSEGTPINLDMDYFFGSWSSKSAGSIGIGRSEENYVNGIVGYPEQGSWDRQLSPRYKLGHSVVLLGYDDEIEITYKLLMNNGKWQTFKERGVYYFRNAWGTVAFGENFSINGKKYPGYGMISQRYAKEFGAFYQLPLPNSDLRI